jgi:hypothetical protein
MGTCIAPGINIGIGSNWVVSQRQFSYELFNNVWFYIVIAK